MAHGGRNGQSTVTIGERAMSDQGTSEPLHTIELNQHERTLLVDALSREIIASAENLNRVSELAYLIAKVVRS